MRWLEWLPILIFGILIGPLIYQVDHWSRTKIIGWVKAHGRDVCLIACAFISGGLLVAYLFFAFPEETHGKPPDSVITLLGAFAGIAVPVGGALWLWQVQELRSEARTRAAIIVSCKHLADGLKYLREQIDEFRTAADQASVKALQIMVSGAQEALKDIARFEYRKQYYQSHLIELNETLQYAHADYEFMLDALGDSIKDLLASAPGWMPGVPKEIVDKAMLVRFNIDILGDHERALRGEKLASHPGK